MISDPGPMRAALALARQRLGSTWPNPSVGCVIVKDRAVIARGATQAGGRPHAETVALTRAGKAAKGATAYVTLEPCSHHGKTPPCAEALVAAGLSRVVAAIEDPDPRVSGRGITKLREAGIHIDTGLCAEEAAELNAGFFLRLQQ
ncbi:MAG TPA: bifunctional diaminohydroxyphosphoribosylaminopyrimidine deaminase/5-amino-6-(5-phosphoribosylamino)uracil reductase RibD, partial [Stellaceae bacterium]|nr:bifunctional diaminohydroxyphosphoribosylaminopyrimidine deaminase/5-amino-6-(5-phosphoribosylamino)uracil reductase RibD [Stellaceae bacterium]